MALLVSTTAPKIVSNRTFGTSLSAIKAGSTICDFATALEPEFEINLAWDNIYSSPNVMNGVRKYAKLVILNGPELDTQTLIDFAERLDTLPPPIASGIRREVDESLRRASNRFDRRNLSNPPTGQDSDYMYDDNDFLNSLIDKFLNCATPCNYFSPISDVIANAMAPQSIVSNNSAPLWDAFSDLIQTPIEVAMVSFNKISQNVQKNVVGLSNAVEGVFRDALEPFFPEERVAEETALLQAGTDRTSTAHGLDLATDTYSYFQTSENQTKYLTNVSRSLGDCFRMYEYHRRYNPLDVDMNKQVATKNRVGVEVEGQTVDVDYQGKKIQPLEKPQADTIEEKLETVEEEYPYDDLPDESNPLPLPDGEGFDEGNPLFPQDDELPEGAITTPPDDVTPNDGGEGDTAADKYNDILNDPDIPSRPVRTPEVRSDEVALTSYTWNRGVDESWDSNSGRFKGNAENLLRVNSLALSRPMVNALKAKGSISLGDKIFVTNDSGQKKFLGYWDDTSPSSKANIDFFYVNPNKYINKNTAISIDRISSEPGTGQIRWTQAKADAMAKRAYSL